MDRLRKPSHLRSSIAFPRLRFGKTFEAILDSQHDVTLIQPQADGRPGGCSSRSGSTEFRHQYGNAFDQGPENWAGTYHRSQSINDSLNWCYEGSWLFVILTGDCFCYCRVFPPFHREKCLIWWLLYRPLQVHPPVWPSTESRRLRSQVVWPGCDIGARRPPRWTCPSTVTRTSSPDAPPAPVAHAAANVIPITVARAFANDDVIRRRPCAGFQRSSMTSCQFSRPGVPLGSGPSRRPCQGTVKRQVATVAPITLT